MAKHCVARHLKSKWAVLKEDVAKVKHTHTHTKRTALPSSQGTMQKRVCNTDSYDRRPLRSQTDLTWKHGDVVCELFEKEMELT